MTHPGAWLRRRDPGWAAARTAVRVTAAACAGFFGCRYGLGDTTAATFAVFGTIAFGGLSDVFGAPPVRTRVYLAALPVAALLVTLGTLAAAHTVTAVAGMLVVGFAVAYAGVGGPRVIGLATGLQLFYILPCFPPYAPVSLPHRLLGLAVGVALIAAADRLLLPAPAPPEFCRRIARTAGLVADYLAGMHDCPRGERPERRAALRAALAELRLVTVPVPQRPTGPGHRDRGLTHATGAVRIIGARVAAMDELLHHPEEGGAGAAARTAPLLDAVHDTLLACVAGLRGEGPPPEAGPLCAVIETYLARRAAWVAARGDATCPPPGLRVGVAAIAVAESTRGLVAGVRAAMGAGPDPTAELPPSADYVRRSALALWRSRLLTHLTPRSVYLQNAVRLALALAAARALVDVFGVQHGLWVLLATLTLMRTSVVASGAALLPAFGGTLLGAALAAGMLTVLAGHAVVFSVLLPVVMVLAFTAGAVFGPLAGQAGFTLVVATLFAQLGPASAALAGERLLDVLAGGLIGALTGAAAWPRGGGGEIRRIARAALHAGSTDLVTTVDVLGGVRAAPTAAGTGRLAELFEDTFGQYRTEPGHARDLDWLVLLSVVSRLAGDAGRLRTLHPEADPLPWPAVSGRVDEAARDVAEGYRRVAEALAAHRTSGCGAEALMARLAQDPPRARYADDPHAALRALDAWGWLQALAHDLDRCERAVTPAAP